MDGGLKIPLRTGNVFTLEGKNAFEVKSRQGVQTVGNNHVTGGNKTKNLAKKAGGGKLKILNLVVIDGKEVRIEDLPEEEREELVNNLNRTALKKFNYAEEEN